MCRSVPDRGDLCEHHTRLAAELGRETVLNGDHAKRRNARQRISVDAESERLELRSTPPIAHPLSDPRSHSPPRRKSRRSGASYSRLRQARADSRGRHAHVPSAGKARQEISVPDHGARIKAVETLLREGLGRVGEARSPNRGCQPLSPRSGLELERDEVHLRDLVRAGDPARSWIKAKMHYGRNSSGGNPRRARPCTVAEVA